MTRKGNSFRANFRDGLSKLESSIRTLENLWEKHGFAVLTNEAYIKEDDKASKLISQAEDAGYRDNQKIRILTEKYFHIQEKADSFSSEPCFVPEEGMKDERKYALKVARSEVDKRKYEDKEPTDAELQEAL